MPSSTICPTAVAAHAGSLLPRLCRAIRAATGADGINVIINNGRVAGQTIDHCHWHIIPRFRDDPVNWPWPQGEYVGDELGQMKFRIERELGVHYRTPIRTGLNESAAGRLAFGVGDPHHIVIESPSRGLRKVQRGSRRNPVVPDAEGDRCPST